MLFSYFGWESTMLAADKNTQCDWRLTVRSMKLWLC